MRKMKSLKHDTTINVVQHITIKNGWEYYITDEDTGDKDVKVCLVVGFETELGDVYIPEIEPYIVTRTPILKGLMAAPDWEWIN